MVSAQEANAECRKSRSFFLKQTTFLKLYKMKRFLYAILALVGVTAFACVKESKKATVEAEKKWTVSTLAGSGDGSFVNGPLLSAAFHFPEDVVVAPDGSLFVTDVLNHCIRKILSGQVSTFAGGSGFGIIDGNAASAQFKSPLSVTADAQGNLYVTDDNDPRIRKITPAGVVTTYAGTGVPGFADGNADTARFKEGNNIVADLNGNLFVADAGNNRIRKVSVTGQVTTIAGTGIAGFNNGPSALAQFNFLSGIALDKNGNLFVVDRGNFQIRKISPDGNVSTVAGNGTEGSRDGIAAEAQFSIEMHDIVVDNEGNLFVEDGNRIRRISATGIVTTIAGSTPGYADGEGSVAKFNFLAGMGIDGFGNIYVADLINNRIRKISFE
jgi:hypothetical protein